MTATLAAHVDRWAHEILASPIPVEVQPSHGASLASACRGEQAHQLPPALVAVARRLSEGDLAALEARLVRSLARASA
ncbi:hypothetical protein SAMN06264364_105183 [Quadrisphaera granulorum]|uniref:Uncharacterized protein n=1 Tax=Quadrisphaera granulorum TaxID=317664 RepID=A0A316ADL9_9ACTN|nr:hypothetical protein [Quadrisphaera granulorum]PWJ54974.1 hypothetical protein BXY45_105183 [Quadrisphaera granulorum]SZE95920.1 hypothetical protein SAMN06264364_105183 [Quadrisphaera granulorum]